MRITYIYSESLEDCERVEWRCHAPARAINRNSRHSANTLLLKEFVENTDQAKGVCERSDILIVHHNLWGKVLRAIQHWMARGKVVLADFEVSPQLLDKKDPAYDFWHREELVEGMYGKTFRSSPLEQFKWGLQVVSAGVVPSKRLADDWKAYNRIEVVPDYIELDRYETVTREQRSTINLGWKGNVSRLPGLIGCGVFEAIANLLMKRSNVRMILCTDREPDLSLLGLPKDSVDIFPWCSNSRWPEPLSYIDIGLSPLNGDYDQRMGWRSVLEYMVTQTPWVGSQGAAYHQLRPYGWLVENTPEAWERVLADMIDHYSDYQAEAIQGGYLFGLSQSIDENIHHVIAIYAKIANNMLNGIYSIPGT